MILFFASQMLGELVHDQHPKLTNHRDRFAKHPQSSGTQRKLKTSRNLLGNDSFSL